MPSKYIKHLILYNRALSKQTYIIRALLCLINVAMKRVIEEEGDLDMVNCLMLLTKVGESKTNHPLKGGGGAFKCKTCHRQFLSFQALGGHRASHKKRKLMMGADLSCQLPSSSTMKTKMHLCPICGLEFTVGQALGGHMRKHRNALNDDLVIHDRRAVHKSNGVRRFNLCLDLNLTPSENDLKLNLKTPVLNCLI